MMDTHSEWMLREFCEVAGMLATVGRLPPRA